MEKLWFSIANLIAAFVLAPCAILFARQIKIFEKNKKRGYATIVGYDDEDHAKWDDPLVNLDVDEKKKNLYVQIKASKCTNITPWNTSGSRVLHV